MGLERWAAVGVRPLIGADDGAAGAGREIVDVAPRMIRDVRWSSCRCGAQRRWAGGATRSVRVVRGATVDGVWVMAEPGIVAGAR